MRNIFLGKEISRFSMSILLAVALAALAGCGAGVAAGPGVSGITIALTDSAGQPVTSISSSGAPATVRATVRDAAGNPINGVVVTFSTDPALATITPASATARTDASGVTSLVTLSPASLAAAGAGTITATANIDSVASASGVVSTATITGSATYTVGAAAVTITPPVFGIGVASLSAFGTTSVAVTVSSNGVPVTAQQTVSFTSPCASSGKAVLSPSAPTVSGVATASYRDNGCAGTDTITASVSGITSSFATLTVTAPATGSIQFVSVTPASITLKGMGGVGRQESSQVIFKVVDTGGNPIGGKTVSFSLSTSVGGIALSTTTAISDPTTGQVVVGINSGTVSTPVRVTASTVSGTSKLTTQSDQLTITTGIPDQQNFSLSATTFNIEGWSIDGTPTVLTARLADHFGNPVPDGTAVNFTTEGGSVNSSCLTNCPNGVCPPAGTPPTGTCSVTLTSQNFRPANGRLTVLAYAVGEEGFTDLNGNGMADNPATPAEMIDANGVSTDMGEAYVDYNENGVRDAATEPFIDFGGNVVDGSPDFQYNGPDGQYNGVLCDHSAVPGSSAVACSVQKGTHVRGSSVVVFSGSTASITINGGATIALPTCQTGTPIGSPGAPKTFTVTVVDLHGNAMPAGTTVAFSADNGTITSAASYIVPNTSGCRTGVFCPTSAASAIFGNIQVTMKSDATSTDGTAGVAEGFSPPSSGVPATSSTCKNTNGSSGTFTVTVTTPGGLITTQTMTVTD